MNHSTFSSSRSCLLTTLFAMALAAAVPPTAVAETRKFPAIGCVIYKQHSSDQFSFPVFLEYTRKETFPNVINLVTPSGENERVFSEQTPIFISYPNDPNGSREDAAAMIGLARQRFPKAAPKLALIEKAWAAVPPRKVATPTVVPATSPSKGAISLASFTTTDGRTYEAVEITKINPEAISFTHSAGVATIALEKLPPDLQRRFINAPKPAVPATGSVVSTPAVVKPQITASGMPGHDAPLEKPDAAKIAHNNDIEEKEAAKRVLEKKEAQDSSAQMAALNARDPEKKGIGQPDLDRTPAQRENAATAQKPQGVIEKNAQSEKIVTWDEQSFRDRVEQVASGFTIKSGPRAGEFNFNRSYGADQRELGERFRASIRNGLGGYSKEKFMTASAEEQAEMIRDNSRLYLTANNMFGDKMAPDELARRLVNTFDELFGMEANKADGLLLRFWSTSRVVGMSVKELLEFKKRADDYSKSLGAHGGMSLRDLCEMALNAKAATNRGRGIEK